MPAQVDKGMFGFCYSTEAVTHTIGFKYERDDGSVIGWRVSRLRWAQPRIQTMKLGFDYVWRVDCGNHSFPEW